MSVPSPFERLRAAHWPYPLDGELLDGCAEALAGTHDFTAFTPTDSHHTRFDRTILNAAWSRESATILAFEVESVAFMRGMVRALVGTMLEVGTEKRELGDFTRLLDGAARPEAGQTAPAHGLYLKGVTY